MRTTNKFRNAWRQHILIAIAVCVCFSYAFSQTSPPEPANFFHQYVGLTDKQIDEIRDGRALAKILNAASADQVLIFGAVHIEADPESYLKFATDISELQKLPGYLAVRKFSDPPQPSDMEGFTLVADDIKDLKKCKPDDCEFQLPSDAIEEFQRSINWSSPTVEQDVNQLAQSMALDALKRYQSGGNTALGTYRDKKHPAAVAEAFQALLAQSKAMPFICPSCIVIFSNFLSINRRTFSLSIFGRK